MPTGARSGGSGAAADSRPARRWPTSRATTPWHCASGARSRSTSWASRPAAASRSSLAADHLELVNRLVLVASACRLGPGGRSGQRRVLAALEHGDRRRAGAELMALTAGGPGMARVFGAGGWLLPGLLVGHRDPDLLATLRAEDAFDLTARLGSIETPTLVVGGERDAFYGADLFRETAHGLPRGQVLLYPGIGHGGTVSHRRLGRDVLAHLDRD